MTISQLLESVFSKSCAMEGTFGDATAFTSSTDNIAEVLCEKLKDYGFERTGTEMMYSGMTGEPMGLVFIGPVYYQRLKHLISDKWHFRSTGPKSTLVKQPLLGRSREGGLRYGSMEADSSVSHGATMFLKDRLCDQSDAYTLPVCSLCGNTSTTQSECRACSTDNVKLINIPYASKLVMDELKAMLIKIKIN